MAAAKIYLPSFFACGFFLLAQCWTGSDEEVAGFDPNAGYVAPYAMQLANAEGKEIRLDRGSWQSEAMLPQGFVDQPTQNVLLGLRNRLDAAVTDGSLDTPIEVREDETGKARYRLEWPESRELWRIYVKVGAKTPVELTIGGRRPVTLKPEQSYQWIPLALRARTDYIELQSAQRFQIFEIAALAAPPTTYVQVDLGSPKEIGSVYARSRTGAAGGYVETSIDRKEWREAKGIQCGTQQLTAFSFNPVKARYLRLHLPLAETDWAKTDLQSLRLYDRHGPYGPPPPAPVRTPTLRELLGVNGYWGWGGNAYSHLQAPGSGPDRYVPVAGHARNYHDMTWDVTDPDERIDFGRMVTKGTPANEWLDWDKEYTRWRAAGLPIQASLQFQRFEPGQWTTPYESAYAYGFAYARHFGPTHGNGLIDRVEVGNEPWHYPAKLYRTILDGMSAGLKAGDPALPVLPCALQAADPEAETAFFQNYIGARLPAALTERLDGLNAHAYSYAPDFFGRAGAVGPAHPLSTFGEVKNLLRWRDANMPGKPVYLSEWGYDYPGPTSACTHAVCVSPDTAVAYALHTLFYGQRLGLERLTWYYFADEEKPSGLYTRSGLTEEKANDFRRKAVFTAFEQVLDLLGNARLLRVVRESNAQYLYELSTDGRTATHLVSWSPINRTSFQSKEVHGYRIRMGYRWRDGAIRPIDRFSGGIGSGLQPVIYELEK